MGFPRKKWKLSIAILVCQRVSSIQPQKEILRTSWHFLDRPPMLPQSWSSFFATKKHVPKNLDKLIDSNPWLTGWIPVIGDNHTLFDHFDQFDQMISYSNEFPHHFWCVFRGEPTRVSPTPSSKNAARAGAAGYQEGPTRACLGLALPSGVIKHGSGKSPNWMGFYIVGKSPIYCIYIHIYIYKWSIFHCHVWLPDGVWTYVTIW